MEILGNRVYLLLPPLPDPKIKLLPEAEEAYKQEMRSKFDRLKVYAIGEGITNIGTAIPSYSKIQIGDEVFVDPSAVRRGIVLKIGDDEVISVNYLDVMHKW